MSADRKPGIHIAWKTVTYRSVALTVLAGILIFFIGLRLAFPQFTDNGVKAAEGLGQHLLEVVAGAGGATKPRAMNSQQAHFTALDGTVRIKKANASNWTTADYSIPLEKGDVVQTSSEGMAKIVFSDGTNYTVKQDSLIVVEENSANDQQQTNVAVAVSTGTVDLATATYAQGSKSQVIVAGARASLAPDSAAMVHNDPNTDQHEILVKKGSGDITRNGETVRLADWEKVNFHSESAHMEKSKEIGPPTPISPANMAPIFASSDPKVEFSWTKVGNAKGYRLRISKDPYFSSTLVDRAVKTADVLVSGLEQGAYYWMVQSVDGSGKESVESEKNRFTIIPKGKENEALSLELDPFIQHGHVLELTGKTEMGARVMVNGAEVPLVGNDGSFHYFTPPLGTGENVITITAQNAKGGVNTLQKKVVIQ
ncbi:MAG: FecR domain-containing protein [Acidobacteriaceae bacterium]|nr:FecR domain-containing protein [Acidobacteriaceae bacterium]